jgi:hypothetical protein
VSADLAKQTPVEQILAWHTVGRAAYVAPLLIGLFGLIRGWEGAWSSALGVGLVVVNFLLAGVILSISANISLQAYHAAALIGFILRLGIFLALVLVVSAAIPVDRLAFGATAVVSYLALLTLEALAVSRGDEGELTWTK